MCCLAWWTKELQQLERGDTEGVKQARSDGVTEGGRDVDTENKGDGDRGLEKDGDTENKGDCDIDLSEMVTQGDTGRGGDGGLTPCLLMRRMFWPLGFFLLPF